MEKIATSLAITCLSQSARGELGVKNNSVHNPGEPLEFGARNVTNQHAMVSSAYMCDPPMGGTVGIRMDKHLPNLPWTRPR